MVIFDPNWNPAQDLQAQDRSFRYGQKRHVIVFRLLAAGSLEELVYSRQIYKQQLSNIAVSGKMEKRYFEGVQDCKNFQGELFGICNLFRDLSDKVFTREIIELHEKNTLEDGHCQGVKELPTEIGRSPTNDSSLNSENSPNCPFPMKTNEASFSGSKDRKSDDRVMTKKNEPMSDDLGIIYAHRNDDVVNSRPVIQAKEYANSHEDNDDRSIITKKPSVLGKKNVKDDSSPPRKRKKSSEYDFLAQFMGMGKLEFSKWLLSSSPSRREKVLQEYKNYKRRKKSKGHH